VGAVERRKRVREVLAAVELDHRMGHKPTQLSGGERQRTAVARAIINRPRVLLADEPTGNLDSRTTIEVMSLFQELNAQGITIVIVTHEPEVAQYAHRIIDVRDGRIRRDVTVDSPRRAADDLAAYDADAERNAA
jgi:putative ABC transport system ATP-binding protein